MTQLRSASVWALFFVAIFAFNTSSLRAQFSGEKDAPPPTVRVAAVGTSTASQPKFYPGYVTAKETVNFIPRVSGFLEKVNFEEGTLVQKGAVLFEIEKNVYQINVDLTKARIKQIEAEIDLAKKELGRTMSLARQDATTQADLDMAERTIAVQTAMLEAAQVQLKQAELDLSYTSVISPLTGRIGTKKFSEGNYLTPSSGILATVVQLDPIRIEFKPTENDFINFIQRTYQTGNGESKKAAAIEVYRTNGTRYEGEVQVEFAENMVDPRTNTISVFLLCDNKDFEFVPGGYAKVGLAEKFAEPLPSVPVTAMMTDGTHDYVYVVGDDNVAKRQNVKLGPQIFDTQVVLEGLKPGQKIVAGGLNKVTPDKPVTPIESSAPSVAAPKSEESPASGVSAEEKEN